MVLAACGFILGYGAAAAGLPRSALPVPTSDITSATFAVRTESRRGGRTILSGELRSVTSDSFTATASGPIVVQTPAGGDAVRVGETVLVDGAVARFWTTSDGTLGAATEAVVLIAPDWPLVASSRSKGWSERIARAWLLAREAAVARISDAVRRTAGAAAPIVEALVLGDSSAIDPLQRLRFMRSGTMHLLALSGMHLGVLVAAVRLLAARLFGRRAADLIAVAVALLYVLLVGARPGLIRALLLVTIVLFARRLDRQRPLVELLAAAFLLHLLLFPSHLQSVGFVLSYASLAGIALVLPWMIHATETVVPAPIAGPIGAGLAATAWTAPLSLHTFGMLAPVGILASVVMGPLVLALMVGGGIASMLEIVGGAGVRIVSEPVLQAFVALLDASAHWFSGAPVLRGTESWLVGAVAIPGLAATVLGLAHIYGVRDVGFA